MSTVIRPSLSEALAQTLWAGTLTPEQLARVQRERKRQPAGNCAGLGISPCRLTDSGASKRGKARISAWV